MLNAVIMAGGHGERFWPRSRFHKPKQLQAIAGTETMLHVTVKRIKPLIPLEQIYVVTSREIEAEVRNQLPELPEKNIIPEPIGRNTAAAIGLAAIWIRKDDTAATMAVLPADHVIPDEENFLTCLSAGRASAEKQESLVVFGIKPAGPETGYGYIKAGHKIGEENGVEIYPAEAFVEKPDPVTAKKFVESGRHYWNSGMFVWTYTVIMEAIKEYMPRLFEGLEKIRNAPSGNQRETIAEVYAELESASIDYGVMEKAANRIMLRGNFRWDDIGSWLAMERIRQKDELGNVSQGKFVGIDTRDSIIIGDKPLIATIGLSNMIIVATDDAVLVCSKEKAQEVKQMVKKLLDSDLREYVQ